MPSIVRKLHLLLLFLLVACSPFSIETALTDDSGNIVASTNTPPVQFDALKLSETLSVDLGATPPVNIFNEAIVFYSDRDGNSEIYKMKPDGSQQQRLTFN